MAMNPDIKKRWVEALRSGKYNQGKGALRIKKGEKIYYCCLGVLCEICVEDGVIEPATLSEDQNGRYVYGNNTSFPPRQVAYWAGIDSDDCDCDPHVNVDEYDNWLEKDDTPTLSMLNDENHSFADIADLIENDKNL